MTKLLQDTQITYPLSRHLEASTDVWFGWMGAANGFWHAVTNAQVTGFFIHWDRNDGLSMRDWVATAIVGGLNSQCGNRPVVTADILEKALEDTLGQLLSNNGALVVWIIGSQVHFLIIPVAVI